MLQRLLTLGFVALAACTPLADRLAVNPLPSALELRPLMGSVMVRTVSLPSYAAVEEIAIEVDSGLIEINEDVLWADAPERAVTLVLTRTLTDILDIDVGPEPWPFIGLPDVSLDIRVEKVIAGADEVFRLSGQYFIGGDAISFRRITQTFDIEIQMADDSLQSVAAAQAEALLALSEQIARNLGR